MTFGDVATSVVGWIITLGAILWHVRRTKHPSRSLAPAFGVFLGIFGGITVAVLTSVVAAWYALGLKGKQVPGILGGVIALVVVIPAWRFAVGTIRRPSKLSQ